MSMLQRIFPKDFLFGAATSAHQVEGNNTQSDWWEWEQSPRRQEQLKRLGKDPRDFFSGRACDHYNRFHEDFDIAEKLNHNAHRFSIEWARIEPEEGRWDMSAVAHYGDALSALRERAITPIVTLHHFTNPLWFAKRGGWEWENAPARFARYCEFVYTRLGEWTPWWITINEPTVFANKSYFEGKWPPQKKNIVALHRVLLNLIDGHRQAFRLLHTIAQNEKRELRVGIAHQYHAWLPYSKLPWDIATAAILRYLTWHYVPQRLKNECDYIGINYYSGRRVGIRLKGFVEKSCENEETSDLKWEIYPQGLRAVLRAMWNAYRKPLLITENGIADATDAKRARFIAEHLAVLYDALREGIDIRGYLYWSLLDNFEWAHGFSPRFGLVEIDYRTLERKIRPSAYAYAEICKTRIPP